MKSLIVIAAVLLAAGCGNRTQKDNTQGENAQGDSAVLTGAGRDSHGCIGSAGYTWSEVRQECIRLWEAGIKVLPAKPAADSTEAVLAGFIVFGRDSARVELYLPGQAPEILERRSLPRGGYAWNVEDDDTKNVRRTGGTWIVEQRGKLIYTQKDE